MCLGWGGGDTSREGDGETENKMKEGRKWGEMRGWEIKADKGEVRGESTKM